MRTERPDILDCTELGHAIEQGIATQQELANVGLEHTHMIYLVKVLTGTDPRIFKVNPTTGSHFFKIRPNERDTTPSNENGREWDWYILTCPHDPPCPLMTGYKSPALFQD